MSDLFIKIIGVGILDVIVIYIGWLIVSKLISKYKNRKENTDDD